MGYIQIEPHGITLGAILLNREAMLKPRDAITAITGKCDASEAEGK
jgi:hypothetical protein